jgi:NDP-sugar pyrophosphorylase family protein
MLITNNPIPLGLYGDKGLLCSRSVTTDDAVTVTTTRSDNNTDILCQVHYPRNCSDQPLAEVGSNVSVGNNVTVYLSVLGNTCKVGDGANTKFSVLYPGSVIDTRLIENSILGADTFVGDGACLTNFRFDRKTVQVVKNGVTIDTGNYAVGVCLDHGVYLGSGCIVAPGREIPNGLRILPEKDQVITKTYGERVAGYRTV